jgi:hypothetical protein
LNTPAAHSRRQFYAPLQANKEFACPSEVRGAYCRRKPCQKNSILKALYKYIHIHLYTMPLCIFAAVYQLVSDLKFWLFEFACPRGELSYNANGGFRTYCLELVLRGLDVGGFRILAHDATSPPCLPLQARPRNS